MRSFPALVYLILSLASHVSGFRSLALPLIQRNWFGIQQLHTFDAPSTTTIKCQQQKVGTNESNEEPDVVIQIEDLTSSQIAELIEVSFIQACMQLSQGYVDVLKLFIVSVKSAYQRCKSYSSMKDIVSMVNMCPTNTAGRPLAEEEVQLRTTWIYAVALMLDHVNNTTNSLATTEIVSTELAAVDDDDIAKIVQNTYGPILSVIVDLKNTGDSLKTQEFMNQNRPLLPDTVYVDDVQLAIASQTVKVLYYTLTVLEEERLANDSDDISNVARPQIPRGDGIN